MDVQKLFAKHLIINKNMLACHEVSHYGHICDVLAVDRHKQLIFEYEFKASSNDLKVAELTKDKYKPYRGQYRNEMYKSCPFRGSILKEWKKPHYFYFVMPEELFNKEQKYLRSLKVGAMFYRTGQGLGSHIEGLNFYVGKRTAEQKSNPQNYYIALKSLTKRLSNLYAF